MSTPDKTTAWDLLGSAPNAENPRKPPENTVSLVQQISDLRGVITRQATELDTVAKPAAVLAEISAERAAQDTKWGRQNHPDRMPANYPVGDTPNAVLAAVHWKNTNATRVAWMNEQGVPRDRNTAWDGILLEEVYEALAETDPALLRAELVQVAAVAAAWIEAIDRRSAPVVPAPAQQWAVRHPDVRLSVHRSPHSVLYTASKLPGGTIVTRMSDQAEWRVETNCLCGDTKPADRHFEACPGDTPAPQPRVWPAPDDRVVWAIDTSSLGVGIPSGSIGTVTAIHGRTVVVRWDHGGEDYVYARHLRPLSEVPAGHHQ